MKLFFCHEIFWLLEFSSQMPYSHLVTSRFESSKSSLWSTLKVSQYLISRLQTRKNFATRKCMCSMNLQHSFLRKWVFNRTTWSVIEPLVNVTLPLAHCSVVMFSGIICLIRTGVRKHMIEKVLNLNPVYMCARWLSCRWVWKYSYSYNSWPAFKYQQISFHLSKLPIFREFAVCFGGNEVKKLMIAMIYCSLSQSVHLSLNIRVSKSKYCT